MALPMPVAIPNQDSGRCLLWPIVCRYHYRLCFAIFLFRCFLPFVIHWLSDAFASSEFDIRLMFTCDAISVHPTHFRYTTNQIKKAFRFRAVGKALHPDKGGDKNKFQRLNAAMELLNDPKMMELAQKEEKKKLDKAVQVPYSTQLVVCRRVGVDACMTICIYLSIYVPCRCVNIYHCDTDPIRSSVGSCAFSNCYSISAI